MSIRNKLIIVLLTVTIIPTTLFSFLSFLYARKSLKSVEIAKLVTTAELKVERIEDFIAERIGDITTIQSYRNIKINLPLLIHESHEQQNLLFESAKKKLDLQLKVIEKAYGYSNVILLNYEGLIVYASNKKYAKEEIGKSLPYVSVRAFKEGKKRIYFSNIFRSYQENGKYGMFITAPLHDLNKRLIGVVALEVDMTPLYEMIQDTKGLGQTGETLIGKQIGNKALFLNPLRHDPDSTLKRVAVFGKREAFPIQEAVQGREGSGFSVDYRGEKVIAAWRYIPSLDFGLVAKIDTKEAFASINNLRNLTLMLEIIFIIISTTVALFVSQSLTKPIFTLQKGAEIIGSGNLDYEVGIQTQDEIGQLSRSIDQMAKNLKSVTISRDELNKEIEERKITEQRLSNTTQKLTRSNEELEQFAYVASHDLQEPLRMVINFLQLIERRYKGKIDKDADDFIAFAVEGAKRMKMMINDLLIYCRVETQGKNLECTDCEHVLEQTLSYLEISIHENSAAITSDSLPVVMADEIQLIKLFQNLISNALKYRSEKPPRIHIGVKRKDQWWLFSFKDNGIGFDPQYREQIFIIFHRLHDREKYTGTGIGLAVCRKIVERHGGHIWVESEPGKGSTFYFTIPSCECRTELLT
jgi:signal transduction histidine kinase